MNWNMYLDGLDKFRQRRLQGDGAIFFLVDALSLTPFIFFPGTQNRAKVISALATNTDVRRVLQVTLSPNSVVDTAVQGVTVLRPPSKPKPQLLSFLLCRLPRLSPLWACPCSVLTFSGNWACFVINSLAKSFSCFVGIITKSFKLMLPSYYWYIN